MILATPSQSQSQARAIAALRPSESAAVATLSGEMTSVPKAPPEQKDSFDPRTWVPKTVELSGKLISKAFKVGMETSWAATPGVGAIFCGGEAVWREKKVGRLASALAGACNLAACACGLTGHGALATNLLLAAGGIHAASSAYSTENWVPKTVPYESPKYGHTEFENDDKMGLILGFPAAAFVGSCLAHGANPFGALMFLAPAAALTLKGHLKLAVGEWNPEKPGS